MGILPLVSIKSAPGINIVQQATDWQSFSKTLCLEVAFIGATAAVLTGHGTSDIVSLVWALGGTLGLLRISDVVANAFNVRSYLSNPQAQASGLIPQSNNTPLVSTGNGGSYASPTTA